jgi:hypothetical protein
LMSSQKNVQLERVRGLLEEMIEPGISGTLGCVVPPESCDGNEQRLLRKSCGKLGCDVKSIFLGNPKSQMTASGGLAKFQAFLTI